MSISGQSCPQTVQDQTSWLVSSFDHNRNIDIISSIFDVDGDSVDPNEFLFYFASIFAKGVINGDRVNRCEVL